MPNHPLLFFPVPTVAGRNTLGGGRGSIHRPGAGRQGVRIAPQLAVLRQAFEAKRLQLQQAAPLESPEMVLVLEVAGTVDDFAKAVSKVPGLDWLVEWAEEQIAPDADFYDEQESHRDRPFAGRLYLLGSNQEALNQLLSLWEQYQQDPSAAFSRGLAPLKHVFEQLRAIRPWNVDDRIDADMRNHWRDRIDNGEDEIRFEVEAWHFSSAVKNEAARNEVERLVRGLGGRVLSRALIAEIAYHGFLVELPAAAIGRILEGDTPALLLSDRIMFFRPKAQSISDGVADAAAPGPPMADPGASRDGPIVALLDGLPLANHDLLAGRLIIDDPDGWAAGYEAKDRVHGTAMASLILHGELDAPAEPNARKIYVRPVMRPDPADGFNARRTEHTPNDVLLIDLVHRAVKRICEGDAGEAPAAPTVRVINLSMGDGSRIFSNEMSPWARLIDWLSHRYSVLFVVSAGNHPRSLALPTPRGTLGALDAPEQSAMAFAALTNDGVRGRLLAPAESINALTVGALHGDHSNAPVVPTRFDLFADSGISPLSRIGHGYRRAIKPDILMPGGRVLYLESFGAPPATTVLEVVSVGAPPGHRVALPPLQGPVASGTGYCRGTSNAAALASRAAVRAYDVLESLREATANAPPPKFDAVILKAMLVHGASWGELSNGLIDEISKRPDYLAIQHANSKRIARNDFVTRWLGYGAVDVERSVSCTDERATLLGFGELGADEAFVFSAPLPPSLAGTRAWRRVTVTLAWLSPINPVHQGYRRAKLWAAPPADVLRVTRHNSVDDKAARRGTVQHERLEGEDAVAFVDGDRFECKVNCAADAGALTGKVAFALCVSLEVGIESGIAVYQEIRERIAPLIAIQPGGQQ